MKRFILQPSEKEGFSVVTDQINKVVITFENHKFNDNQEVTLLEDFNPENYMQIAKIMREFGDFLSENYYELIF